MRKEMKQAAKANLRKHYWILVVVCLFAGFLGIEYGSSFTAIHSEVNLQINGTDDSEEQAGITGLVTDLLMGDEDAAEGQVEQNKEEIQRNDTNRYLGRSKGVFASILNTFSTGGFLVSLMSVLRNITGSTDISVVLLSIGGLALAVFVWLFIKETYLVIARRITMETRTYEKVPLRRFFYPIHTKKWAQIAWNMFVKNVYQWLWSFTIIGGIIKSYSYRMVPYILAENPNLKANETITLSRKLMDGHKWECFVADVSFLGWWLLEVVTLGLSGIFYSNPYKAAFFGEYYAYLRKAAKIKQTPGVDKLCDNWLYEKPEEAAVYAAYADVTDQIKNAPAMPEAPKGFWATIAKVFGIMPVFSQEVADYEEAKAVHYQLRQALDILDRKSYPGRMAPVPFTNKVATTSNLMPTKSYTLLNLIMMFFIISFIGWLWEVSLHLVSDGVFVNRGVMHGPWLPIYGTGGVLILIALKSLREKPAVEFISGVALCGIVEYFTAWHLEMTHNGQKWWDYTGYFINLDGRICGEGLLIFGLGGLAIVYLLAPALDNLLKKVNRKILAIIAAVLLVVFIGDQIYSSKHPNTGKGITDYGTAAEDAAENSSDWMIAENITLPEWKEF